MLCIVKVISIEEGKNVSNLKMKVGIGIIAAIVPSQITEYYP